MKRLARRRARVGLSVLVLLAMQIASAGAWCRALAPDPEPVAARAAATSTMVMPPPMPAEMAMQFAVRSDALTTIDAPATGDTRSGCCAPAQPPDALCREPSPLAHALSSTACGEDVPAALPGAHDVSWAVAAQAIRMARASRPPPPVPVHIAFGRFLS